MNKNKKKISEVILLTLIPTLFVCGIAYLVYPKDRKEIIEYTKNDKVLNNTSQVNKKLNEKEYLQILADYKEDLIKVRDRIRVANAFGDTLTNEGLPKRSFEELEPLIISISRLVFSKNLDKLISFEADSLMGLERTKWDSLQISLKKLKSIPPYTVGSFFKYKINNLFQANVELSKLIQLKGLVIREIRKENLLTTYEVIPLSTSKPAILITNKTQFNESTYFNLTVKLIKTEPIKLNNGFTYDVPFYMEIEQRDVENEFEKDLEEYQKVINSVDQLYSYINEILLVEI